MARTPLHTWIMTQEIARENPDLLEPAAEHLLENHGELVVGAFHPRRRNGPVEKREREDQKAVLLIHLKAFLRKNRP